MKIRGVRRYGLLFGLVFLLALLPLAYFQTRQPGQTEAAWYDEGYRYRQEFSFTHNAAINDNRAITFTLDTAELITDGAMQADCDDTRFTDANGQELAFDLTGTCDNASTTYEVIFPTIINGTQVGYVYYGNTNAQNAEVDSTQYTALTPSGGDPGAITDRTNEETSPGPSAYWSFDEGQDDTCPGGSNDACDSSGSGRDGAFGATTAAPTWQTEDECIQGKCLYFDGSDDYMQFTSTNAFSTSAGTVSLWAKANGSQASPSYIFSHPQIGDFSRVYLSFQNGGYTVDCIIGGISQVIGTYTLSDSEWTHLACTWDGTSTAFYVNGVEQTTTSSIVALSSIAADSYLGSWDGTQEYFNGSIDEVRIYDYARSADQVKQDFNSGAGVVLGQQDQSFLSDGLVGYWPMDESSGTNVADASGNGNDGTLTNAQETGTSDGSGNSTTTLIDTDGTLSSTDDAYNGMILYITDDGTCGLSADEQRLISDYNGTTQEFTVSTAFSAAVDTCVYEVRHQVGGKFGNGMEYDGVNDYTISTTNIDCSLNQTVSGWFKGQSTGGNRTIFELQSCGGRFLLYYQNSNALSFYPHNSLSTVATTNTFSNDSWHHYTVTTEQINATQVKAKIFVNGALEKEGTVDFTSPGTANKFFLGSVYSYNANFFNGSLDETRLYNRALSPTEVQALYNWAPGPVGYWNFEEKSGTTTADATGNGNTGTLNGPQGLPEWTTGKYGSGLFFPGDPDGNGGSNGAYVSLVGNSAIHPNFGISLGAWVKKEIGASKTIFRGQSTEAILDFYTATTIRFGVNRYQDALYATDDYPDDGKWHYVAGTYDGSQLSIYIDGVLVESGAYSELITQTTNPQYIGARNDLYADYFVGYIDEVKLYNYARTQEQILMDMSGDKLQVTSNKLPTPLAYYAFDEMSGTTANNSISDNYSMTMTNSPTWAEGKINGALDFESGDSDYLSNTIGANIDNEFTITSWIKPETMTVWGGIVTAWNNGGFKLATQSDNTIDFGWRNTGGSYNDCTATGVNTGSWQHVAASFKAGTGKIYIDGQLKDTCTGDADITNASNSYEIGSSSDNSAYFDGLIDEVKIYNTALSATQVNQDMSSSAISFGTSGSTKRSLVTGTFTPPVGHWSFDEGSGLTTKDLSGNDNTGTLEDMDQSAWVQGKSGKALNFTGNNENVTISDPAGGELDFGTGSMTVMAWIKAASSDGTYRSIIDKKYAGSNTAGFYLWISSGDRLLYTIANGTAQQQVLESSTIDLHDNKWHHIVASLDRTGGDDYVYMYIDGLRVRAYDLPNNGWDINSTTDIDIGENNAGTGDWTGQIDDVKLFDYALSQEQVAYEYNQGKPIAHWQFDECQGTTAYDAGGHDLHGTITPGAGSNTSVGTCNSGNGDEMWDNGSTGKINASLDFDGTDDYVSIPDSIFLSPGLTNHTANIWFKTTTDLADTGWLYSNYGSSSNNLIGIAINSSDILSCTYRDASNNTAQALATSTYNDGSWHMATCVRDGTTAQLYVDGIEVDTDTNGSLGSIVTTGRAKTVGTYAANPTNQDFDGQIDDLQIFQYALSASQIKQLYNGGVVSFE